MKIFNLIILLFLLLACSAKRDPIKTIKVSFTIPHSSQKDFDSTQNPSDVSGFNCVAVFIGYPDKSAGTCNDSSGNTIASPFDMVGMVQRPGGQLETDVEVGPNRTFHLVGFNVDLASVGGSCPNVFSDFGPIEDHLSEPFILASVTAEIFPVATQNINFNSVLDSNKKISDCTGSLFDGIGGPLSSFIDFGDGSDGNATFNTTGPHNKATNEFFQVTAINTTDPRNVTVDGSDLTNFGPGKEVMWYVNDEGTTTGCGGLASSFHPGMFGFLRVVASSGSLITFDRPFNEYINLTGGKNILDIPSSSLLNGTVPSFCGVQIVYVPNYNDLTIDTASGSISFSTASYNSSVGYGGILPIKVAGTLDISGANPVSFNVLQNGFPSTETSPVRQQHVLQEPRNVFLWDQVVRVGGEEDFY